MVRASLRVNEVFSFVTQVPTAPQSYDIVVLGDVQHPAAGWVHVPVANYDPEHLEHLSNELEYTLELVAGSVDVSAVGRHDPLTSEAVPIQFTFYPTASEPQPLKHLARLQHQIDAASHQFSNTTSPLYGSLSLPVI